jgi:hypothetical protein
MDFALDARLRMSKTSRHPFAGLTGDARPNARPDARPDRRANGNGGQDGAKDVPVFAPREAWDEPEPDRSDPMINLDARDNGPSRARLAVLTAAASFAIVLLVAAAVAAVRQWHSPAPGGGVTAVTTTGPATAGPRHAQASTFTFDAPAGWSDRSKELRDRLPTSPGVTSEYILSGPSSAGVLANISITRTQVPERQRSLDVLRQDFLVGLRNRNTSAEPIGAPIYLEVAGADATSFEFRYHQKDVDVAGRAVIIARKGNVYLILFQTGEVDYDLHVNALWELLESWHWR